MNPREITRALKLRGITQRQIAESIGVTPNAVSNTVNGMASVRVQQAIAEALGMSIDDVFPLKGKQKNTENNTKTEAGT